MKKPVRSGRSLIASFVASAIASALYAPNPTCAQEAGATLQGKADPDKEVTAKNVETGLTRRTKVASDGSYTIVGLPAGTYNVDAGPGTEQVVTLSVASTETLDLGKLQTITVSGTRLVENKTSEIGQVISLHDIDTVPQLTRNFLEFADTVPGIVFNVDQNHHPTIRGGAQSEDSVNVYIDGVGQKGYVRSGLSGQSDATQGNPFPQLAIAEYKVITSNYKAEYDQISSAAVTAETRSGTNRFEAQIFGTYTTDHFRAETPGELNTVPNVKTPSKDKEYGLAFGGPIIKDAMHFFVTYEGKRYDTPITVNIANSVPPNVILQLPAEARVQLGPAQIKFTENLYFGKLDWEPTTDDRFVLSSKVRRESGDANIGTGQAKSSSVVTDNTETRVDLRWERSADRWFNSVLATYEDAFYNPTGVGAGTNGADYTYRPTNDSLLLATDGIDPRAFQNKGQKGWALADELTFSHLTWWTGDHTVKMGIKHKWVKLTAQDGSATNNPIFFYDVSAPPPPAPPPNGSGLASIPWKAVFASVTPGSSPVVTSSDRQLGLYLQDDWATNDRLTFNLGVRWDIEWNPSYLHFVTPQFFVNDLNTADPGCSQPAYSAQCSPGQTYGQSLAKGGVNPNDYVSNGHNRSAYTSEFQPRLGFSYDLAADQRHVVFGGIGRAYDRDLYDYLQLEQTKIALSEPTVRFNVPDHPCNVTPPGCVNWDPKYLNGVQNLQALVAGSAGEVDLLNNHLKVPYSDQFSLGIRNRLGDWNTSAAVARINSYDGFVFTLGNRRPDGSFWGPVPWGGPAQPWLYAPPGLAGNFIIGNNGIKTRTTQLLLSADKPFTRDSHWGATFAYTFTNAQSNRDVTQHYAFDEEFIGAYPFINSNAVSKHRWVATGSYQAPWGFILAGKLTVATPIPKNDISCFNTAGASFPQGGQCSPVAYTAAGLGYRSFDMQLTKNFEIQDISSIYLRFDVLNVFNVKNYIDYLNANGQNGLITGGAYDPHGNISGSPRELRMSLGARF
jgi:outer membrane receptor protein involved in Fe transport